jgi:hypothetical protein
MMSSNLLLCMPSLVSEEESYLKVFQEGHDVHRRDSICWSVGRQDTTCAAVHHVQMLYQNPVAWFNWDSHQFGYMTDSVTVALTNTLFMDGHCFVPLTGVITCLNMENQSYVRVTPFPPQKEILICWTICIVWNITSSMSFTLWAVCGLEWMETWHHGHFWNQ